MSLTDKLIRHQIFLERFAGSVAKTIQNGIDRARDAALAALLNGNNNLNVNQLQIDLERLIKIATDKALEEIKELSLYEADFNVTLLKKELVDVAEATEAVVLAALLNKAMPVGLADKKSNRKIESALNQFARNTAKQIAQPVKDSQITGGDVLVAAATITALSSGLLSAQSKSITRSASIHASSVAKTEVLKESNLKQERWLSILDSVTTDYCRGQNGKVYNVGEGPHPPAHYNCRSIRVLIYD